MAMTENISRVLNTIKQRGLFQSITRYPYLPYEMNLAFQFVEAIGKERTPRFLIDNENRFVYENMIRWVHGDDKMQCIDPETKQVKQGRLDAGIFIAGNAGTGKSWVLEIMSAYSLIDNVQISLGENRRCLYWGNIRTDSICDEYVETGTFEKYKKIAIVGLQDLGSEPIESMHMGNRAKVIRQLIEYRGDITDLMTLITSNIPLNHKMMVDTYGDRVVSRLYQMCNYFELKGKDRRKI